LYGEALMFSFKSQPLNKVSIFIFLIFICSQQIVAQAQIEEIIVSARRFPTSFNLITVPVEVLNQEEIRSKKSSVISSLLDSFPGIHFANTGPLGSETTVSLRGQYQRYLKVYIDGIELSDPSGAQTAPDLTNLLSFGISRIELIRGSMGSIYGGDAVAGVIDIKTELSSPTLDQQRLFLSFGTYNTYNLGYLISSVGSDGHFSLSLNKLSSEGFSALDKINGNTEKDGHETDSIRLGFSKEIGAFKIRSTLMRNNSMTEYDDFYADDVFGNYTNKKQTYFMTELTSADPNPSQLLRFSYSSYDRAYYNEDYPANYQGTRETLEYLANVNSTIVAGIVWDNEKSISSDGLDAGSSTIGAFSNINFNFSKLNLSPSIRIENNSAFGTNSTPSLSLNYLLSDQLKIRSNFSRGYRAPSNYELFAPNVGYGPIGNINLSPEKSTSRDVGVDYTNTFSNFGINLYSLSIKNLIYWEYGLGNTQSDKSSNSKGVELYGAWIPKNNYEIQASFSHTESKDSEGAPLIRVPKNKTRLTLLANELYGHQIQITISHAHKTFGMNYFNFPYEQVKLKNYTLASLQISRELTSKNSYSISLHNVLDAHYQTAYGYGAEGRSIYFTYEADL
jgi:vitamin B12 transporter